MIVALSRVSLVCRPLALITYGVSCTAAASAADPQLSVRSGRLTTAILRLTVPIPLSELATRLGPGDRYWALDATSESVGWKLDAVTVTAQLSPDDRAVEIGLAVSDG